MLTDYCVVSPKDSNYTLEEILRMLKKLVCLFLLVASSRIMAMESYEPTLLDHASYHGNKNAVEALLSLEKSFDKVRHAFHFAIRGNQEDIIALYWSKYPRLLEPINLADALITAIITSEPINIKRSLFEIPAYPLKTTLSMVDFLIKKGADVNNHNGSGYWEDKLIEKLTPLHMAAHFGNVEAVKLLLEHGADVNARNSAGQTPEEFAKSLGEHIIQLNIHAHEQAKKKFEQFQKEFSAAREEIYKLLHAHSLPELLKQLNQDLSALL